MRLLNFLFFIAFFLCISFMSCKTDKKNRVEDAPNSNVPAYPEVKLISHTILGQSPHDLLAFTEGLLFNNGKLYESTGSPEEIPSARSIIGEVDMKSGKINVKAEIDGKKFFGEGIVFLNDKVYQLTYKNQLGFIYDAKTFKSLGTFKYINAEGWGMTTDGKSLIMSDGTDKISFWNPTNFSIEKTLNVKALGKPQIYLNELEYINGYIYANIWTTPQIAKIDPATGNIVGVLDLSNVMADARAKNPKIAEMNGIAFNPANNLVYVTGKFWPSIYQIDFSK
jgi:glutaminyl-peptide cyclotransferase